MLDPRIIKCVLPLTCLILIQYPASSSGHLRLVENGYEGLVIAISNSVPGEQCSQVILGLKGILQEFSKLLSTFTEGRAWLRDVTVILPSEWKAEALPCPYLSPLVTTSELPNVHIKVTAPHPIFGSLPWTQQTQGCTKEGDFIQMGSDFLLSSSSSASAFTRMAELLIAEWVKFRWGTFEENGFRGDPLYPEVFIDPHTSRVRPNACNNLRADFSPVCPLSSHIPEAPTKQNAHCRGEASLDVIFQSQDFQEGRNKPPNVSSNLGPSLTYMKESPPQMVLVVEDTAAMNLQQRWEFIRKAVRHVMVYDVPDDAYVAVVIFNSVAKTTAPLIKVDSYSDIRQRIGASLPRNPSTVPESQKSILHGFHEAMKVLSNSPYGFMGGKVILVTTGNGFTPATDIDGMMHLAVLSRIRIDTIFYPLTEHRSFITDASHLKSVVAMTGGSSYSVMDEGVGKDSKIGMMVGLINALFSTMRYSPPLRSPNESVLVHSQSYQGGITLMAEGSFIIDESFGPNFRFSVFYYDLSHVGNTVQLKSPTAKVIDAINIREDSDANIVYFSVLEAERGYWHYQVENRADSHQALHIQVTSTESNVRQISLRLWSNHHLNVINMTDSLTPVIIYAEVKEGSLPILNAKVTAKLQRLGINVSGSSYNSITFDLLDNGNGDPDITGDDGVYSRYLPSVYGNTGYYQLSVTADNNGDYARSPVEVDRRQHGHGNQRERVRCCGSKLVYKSLKPVLPFQRSSIYGVLDITSLSSGMDLLPPTRILDLRSEMNQTTFTMSLHWTAPGDDYDNGRAHYYEAIIANSWDDANEFDGELFNDLPSPKYSGREQHATIRIERFEQIVYVALRAVDKAGNRGPVSNIAAEWVPAAPTKPPVVIIPMTLQPSTNNAQPLGSEVTVPQRVSNVSLELIAIIIGSTFGVLCIVIILVALLYFHITRSRGNLKSEEDKAAESRLNDDANNDSSQSAQASTENVAKTEEPNTEQPLSPTLSCSAAEALPMHPCQMLQRGPSVEVMEPQSCFQICPDPFPDIVHMSNSSCQLAQASPSVQSNLTPHQSPYTKETLFNYPSPSHFEFPNPSSPYNTCVMSSFMPETPTAHTQEVPTEFSEITYQADLSCPAQLTCPPVNTFCTPMTSPLCGPSLNVASSSHQGNMYCHAAFPMSYGPCANTSQAIHHADTFCSPMTPISYGAYQTQATCSHQGTPPVCNAVPAFTYDTSANSQSYSEHNNPAVTASEPLAAAQSVAGPSDVSDEHLASLVARISPPAPFKPSPEDCVTTVSSTVTYNEKKCTEVTHL
ncbi:calcium-activated chloride channel regulator 1-like isoform X1 [Macrobrachium nipponense]|uniref:calcium-activated chloride channel regulator 1-like isoform X1 n=2 Tax=Macrobrachium nipponense TaxID=159736 RepID=UPI0030C80CE6